MIPPYLATAACAASLVLLVACSRSTALDAIETQSRQVAKPAPPLNTEADIARAIAATRYAALSVGLGFVGEREKAPNGADSGVHEFPCFEGGFGRFDETRKETTYFDCQVSLFGLGSAFLDGFVNEDCRGKTGDIRCFGSGTPEEAFLFRVFDNDEEVGGEARSFTLRNTAYTAGTDSTISGAGTEWRSRPNVTQAGIAVDGFRLIQDRTPENSREARDSHATFFGSFFISSDEGFNCINGTLTAITQSTVTMNSSGVFVAGQVRITNDLNQSVVVDYLPNGSAIYRSAANQVGHISLENLQKHCPSLTVSSASDDEPSSVTLRMFSPTFATTHPMLPVPLLRH